MDHGRESDELPIRTQSKSEVHDDVVPDPTKALYNFMAWILAKVLLSADTRVLSKSLWLHKRLFFAVESDYEPFKFQ